MSYESVDVHTGLYIRPTGKVIRYEIYNFSQANPVVITMVLKKDPRHHHIRCAIQYGER